jgi:hypothetical protein
MTLREYLEKHQLTEAQFVERSGIPSGTVYRLLSKKPGGVHMRTALALFEATKGEVGIADLPRPKRRKKRRTTNRGRAVGNGGAAATAATA